MQPKLFHIIVIVLLTLFVLMPTSQCGPLPKVDEQQLSKIPQWHCLRYFKHDLLMMRRCRHLHVPTAPRSGNVK
ncbi:PREDICTED: uncharacterized protein LOC108973806 [Bactrocera latifrons]|uniref:uncharacterized protein LOC108973806 n=1 Tax=Bactrocera latifrons TaxID=174628 RepID=UPI0008DE87AD|nr:PREDICTED: uncharacterized protein LOC108973806 [Bactrocera latifrons]